MLNFLLKRKLIIRYLIAGSAAALVDLSLLYFFTSILGVWYLISASLAFAVAFFVSFFLQKFWTFRDRDKEAMYKQMGVYLAVALLNLSLNAAVMYVLVDGFKIWYMLAQVMASGLIACESYLVNKTFIFNGNGKFKNGQVSPHNPTGLGGGVKVLIATGIYPPDFRGPATMLEALPEALRRKNFQVRVLTYSDVTGTAEEKGRVYRILRRGPGAWRHLEFFCLMFFLSLSADVIYCTDIYSVGYFAYLIKKLTGKKYIVRFAGDSAWETAVRLGLTSDYIMEFQTKIYNRQIEKLKSRRQKIMVNADKIIAVSKFLAGMARIMGAAADRIRLIYNSIDFIDDNYDENKIRQIRGQFGVGAKIIISTGQLNPWKGFDGLIKSLPEIIKKIGDKVHLLILGEGQEMENLKTLSSDLGVGANVHLLGRVEHKEIMDYFKAADLFILNSNYEGLSHTLLEVMKAGTPIVVSNIAANQEVIEDGRQGMLISYNNTEEISRAAVKILQDENLARSCVSQAKEKLKIFNWENTVRLTVEVVNDVVFTPLDKNI